MKKITAGLCMVAALAAVQAMAGVSITDDNGNCAKLTGYGQLQYYVEDQDEAKATDTLSMRRLRVGFEGNAYENWKGRLELDFGRSKADIKDAYACYTGFKYISILLGNTKAPFSREEMTSSKCKQLVESVIVGDTSGGVPGEQVGVHLSGNVYTDKLNWKVSVCKANQEPSFTKLAFKSVATLNKATDLSEGNMAVTRFDWYPQGPMTYSQADFSRELKTTLSVAWLGWMNDETTGCPCQSNQLDDASGFEVSGALRWKGVSIDAELDLMTAELFNESVNQGLFEDGRAEITSWGVQGGYMLWTDTLEAVIAYHNRDADGYDTEWKRIAGGLNWYIKKHDVKCQAIYAVNQDKNGDDGNNVNEMYVQAQYAF